MLISARMTTRVLLTTIVDQKKNVKGLEVHLVVKARDDSCLVGCNDLITA
jgi:hypothetical protein